MGNLVQKVTTDISFHGGRLVPVGTVITIDTDKVDLTGNTSNIADVGSVRLPVSAPIAAIAPTGPSPTMPQQTMPGAFQTATGFVDGNGADMTAEGAVEEEAPVRRLADGVPGAEAAFPTVLGSDDAAELARFRAEAAATAAADPAADPAAFAADAVINGTVPEVAARLEGLTREQLNAVRAAEQDREQPRTGVQNAIELAIEKLGTE